jgi:hypothetical protein
MCLQMQMLQQQKIQTRHFSSLTLLCKVCVQKLGTLLPHNDVMISANGFHELIGECEVFEELNDAAILQMIIS